MKTLITLTLLLIFVGFTWANRPEAPPPPPQVIVVPQVAIVTYTRHTGEQWVDTGIIVRDLEQPSSVPGYNLRQIFFTDHENVYHLDEGTVEVVYR